MTDEQQLSYEEASLRHYRWFLRPSTQQGLTRLLTASLFTRRMMLFFHTEPAAEDTPWSEDLFVWISSLQADRFIPWLKYLQGGRLFLMAVIDAQDCLHFYGLSLGERPVRLQVLKGGRWSPERSEEGRQARVLIDRVRHSSSDAYQEDR